MRPSREGPELPAAGVARDGDVLVTQGQRQATERRALHQPLHLELAAGRGGRLVDRPAIGLGHPQHQLAQAHELALEVLLDQASVHITAREPEAQHAHRTPVGSQPGNLVLPFPWRPPQHGHQLPDVLRALVPAHRGLPRDADGGSLQVQGLEHGLVQAGPGERLTHGLQTPVEQGLGSHRPGGLQGLGVGALYQVSLDVVEGRFGTPVVGVKAGPGQLPGKPNGHAGEREGREQHGSHKDGNQPALAIVGRPDRAGGGAHPQRNLAPPPSLGLPGAAGTG